MGILGGVAVVLVFLAVVSVCCYWRHKRRHQPLLTQLAYRATTTTIATNNPQVQTGVRAHPANYQTQSTYQQKPYPPAQQGYIPQQQLHTNTGDYPQQSQTTAGMLVEEVFDIICTSR